jgi:hypothetical protein
MEIYIIGEIVNIDFMAPIRATTQKNLKVGCLHHVACTRSGSGFPSNATLF